MHFGSLPSVRHSFLSGAAVAAPLSGVSEGAGDPVLSSQGQQPRSALVLEEVPFFPRDFSIPCTCAIVPRLHFALTKGQVEKLLRFFRAIVGIPGRLSRLIHRLSPVIHIPNFLCHIFCLISGDPFIVPHLANFVSRIVEQTRGRLLPGGCHTMTRAQPPDMVQDIAIGWKLRRWQLRWVS